MRKCITTHPDAARIRASKGVGIILALALAGCAQTPPVKYAPVYCLTQAQLDQLKASKPGKVHPLLNGEADHDEELIAGRLIRVEAWSDGLLTVLGGCVGK